MEAVLGAGLLLATTALVVATILLANHTKTYVDLTRRSLQAVEAASTPRLKIRSSASAAGHRQDAVGKVTIGNVGGGLAEDLVVVTSWGEAKARNPLLRPDEETTAQVAISRKDWEARRGTDDEAPVPQVVRFKDVRGIHMEVPVLKATNKVWTASAWPID